MWPSRLDCFHRPREILDKLNEPTLPQPLVTYALCFVSINFPILGTSDKWDHICPFSLRTKPLRFVHTVAPVEISLFSRLSTIGCMSVLRFARPFVCPWTPDGPHLLAVVNNAAVNKGV